MDGDEEEEYGDEDWDEWTAAQERRLRIMEAQVAITRRIANEAADAAFRNSVRLIKSSKAKNYKEWQEAGRTVIAAAAERKDVSQARPLARSVIDINFKELINPQEKVESVKKMLRTLKLDTQFILVPPYNAERNMERRLVESIMYAAINTFEYISEDDKIEGADRPKATFPNFNDHPRKFSIATAGHTWVSGVFGENDTVKIHMEETLYYKQTEAKASDVWHEFRARAPTPHFIDLVYVRPTPKGLEAAPERGKGKGKGKGTQEGGIGKGKGKGKRQKEGVPSYAGTYGAAGSSGSAGK